MRSELIRNAEAFLSPSTSYIENEPPNRPVRLHASGTSSLLNALQYLEESKQSQLYKEQDRCDKGFVAFVCIVHVMYSCS